MRPPRRRRSRRRPGEAPPVGADSRKIAVAGQLGQPPGETVLYSIDVASLAKQSSQYGLQFAGNAFLLKKAPAIYHLKQNLRDGFKITKTAIINN